MRCYALSMANGCMRAHGAVVGAAVIAVLGAGAVARAEEAPAPPQRSGGAVAAAVMPGLIVHAAGSWVAGERRAARRLFSRS